VERASLCLCQKQDVFTFSKVRTENLDVQISKRQPYGPFSIVYMEKESLKVYSLINLAFAGRGSE
jgi:hypothetical protein